MTRWTCPYCGCGTNHYSAQRLAFVCDACGMPLRDERADQDRMAYDRTLALARENLTVGNWETSISLISPLCSQRPSDPQLYLILLAATTKNYTDFLIGNTAAQKQAAIYWDKLAALHCVNNAMVQYAQQRRQEILNLRNKNSLRSGRFLLYIGITLIVAGAADTAIKILALLGIGGWIWWWIAGYRDLRVPASWTSYANPFNN